MDEWVGGWMSWWMDEWVDGWMHGWVDGWMTIYPSMDGIALSKKNHSVCFIRVCDSPKRTPEDGCGQHTGTGPSQSLLGGWWWRLGEKAFHLKDLMRPQSTGCGDDPRSEKKRTKAQITAPLGPGRIERKCVSMFFLIRRKGKYQLERWGRAVEMNALVIFLILTLDLCLLQGSNKNEQIMLTSRDMCLFHLLICIIWDCLYYYYFFNFIGRTSLVALWLGLCASNAEVSSWILFWGTKILQVI